MRSDGASRTCLRNFGVLKCHVSLLGNLNSVVRPKVDLCVSQVGDDVSTDRRGCDWRERTFNGCDLDLPQTHGEDVRYAQMVVTRDNKKKKKKNNDDNNNNNNERISRAPFHVKHAQLS